MVVVASRSPGVVLLLLAAALLLACTATGVAAATGNSSTICDTAECGKGTCSEVPGIIPLLTAGYKCTCDPGWEQPKLLFNLTVPFAPCIIPDCSFGADCSKLGITPTGATSPTTPTSTTAPPPGSASSWRLLQQLLSLAILLLLQVV
ncbi:unnamed protein product [Miscanthus lutarioriparius]|uniref:Uncharacterized protein n=1 Tax=Miscanthus lutarioriparius TaxID=422564 RepID=A0A811MYE8_9POAL|nr:unnamed protein product [Miscanthus lutarioriparius]